MLLTVKTTLFVRLFIVPKKNTSYGACAQFWEKFDSLIFDPNRDLKRFFFACFRTPESFISYLTMTNLKTTPLHIFCLYQEKKLTS